MHSNVSVGGVVDELDHYQEVVGNHDIEIWELSKGESVPAKLLWE